MLSGAASFVHVKFSPLGIYWGIGRKMVVLIRTRRCEQCITMDRTIVDCVDTNWNELILDGIQR